MEKRICVFCSSSDKINQSYFNDAATFAKEAVKNGYTIVCGGGSRGLMGQITHTATQCGGKVIGIMPEFMRRVEWDSKELSQLIIVNDMRERKKQMIENVDAVVTLAGGTGTLDEVIEVITLKRLGQFTKPIVFLNTNGLFNSLKDLFNTMIKEKFMNSSSIEIWNFANSPEEVFNLINRAAPWDADEAMQNAVV